MMIATDGDNKATICAKQICYLSRQLVKLKMKFWFIIIMNIYTYTHTQHEKKNKNKITKLIFCGVLSLYFLFFCSLVLIRFLQLLLNGIAFTSYTVVSLGFWMEEIGCWMFGEGDVSRCGNVCW
jgi:membrane protein required for beta-lactamase induction